MTVSIQSLDKPGQYKLLVEDGRLTRVLELSLAQLGLLQVELSKIIDPRDEHHTMSELYAYRMLYNAYAANAWASAGTYPVVKSWYHSDGEACFGGGWFIVVADLPGGQISNHYHESQWGLFDIPEVDKAPEWDGHNPQVAAERLHGELERRHFLKENRA